MKYTNKYGIVDSEEFNSALIQVELLLKPYFENVDGQEAFILSSHIISHVNFLAARRSLLLRIEDVNKEEE